METMTSQDKTPAPDGFSARALPATKARIENAVELFRGLLIACEAGDSGEAHRLQRILFGRRIAVKVQPARYLGLMPASTYPLDPPRAVADDGSPLELVSVAAFVSATKVGRKWIETAMEKGWLPYFLHNGKRLLDRAVACRVTEKLTQEFTMVPCDSAAHRIPDRRAVE